MPSDSFDLSAVDRPSRERTERRHSALKNERSSFDAHHKELADYILPRRQRWDTGWRNRGTKRNDKIVNNAATIAKRTLASGMMAGLTSPSRPWFRLVTRDRSMMELPKIKNWLALVEERIRLALHRSNIYNALSSLYGDLAVFGTSVLYLEADFEYVARASLAPVGSYCIALDSRSRVNTVYRELSFSVSQIAERFGVGACSSGVQDAFRRGSYDDWVDVVHVVEPRRFRKRGRLDSRNKAYRSLWYEAKCREKPWLGESGYDLFPCLAPRWDVTTSSEDVYGSSAAMDALGDIKALQTLERRAAQLMDKIVNPPMVAPAVIQRKGGVGLLPGDTTWVPTEAAGGKVEPAFAVDSRALMIEDKIKAIEARIDRAFYADLFLLLAQSDLRQPRTATEIAELHEEKVLQLGPVLQRLDDELLSPLIDWLFYRELELEQVPPAPEPLMGEDLGIEFVSVLAAAQKLLGIANIERFFGFVGNLAAAKPEILDKVDFDQAVDEYGDKVGVPPSLIVSDANVAKIRAARAQQQQMAEAAAMAPALKDTTAAAKNLADSDTSGSSALTRLLSLLGPQAAQVAA